MRIGIAQIETRAGDFAGAARRMADCSRRAAEAGVELLVFPAAALCGVAPVPRTDREGFLLDLMESLVQLLDELACPCLIPLLIGTDDAPMTEALLVDGDQVNPVRLTARLEALAASEGGEPAADALPEVAFGGARLGVAFTYDDLATYDDYDYDVDVIVFLSGYGFAVDDPSSALGASLTEGRFLADAEATGAWIVGVGSLGCYDGQVFSGSSFVLAPWGELAAQAPSLEEDLLICDVDPSAEGPLDDPVTPEVYDAPLMTWGVLGAGLAGLVREAGAAGACVIVTDALADLLLAVLAVDALGPMGVGVVLARGGAAGSGEASAALVRALRLPDDDVEVVDVSAAADAVAARDLLEARLAAMGRRQGRVPLGSRDKTGRALEGDAGGLCAARIEPFADVYRSDLLALARTRAMISPVIPVDALARFEVPEVADVASLGASPEERLAFADLVLSGFLEWELSVSDLAAERGHADEVAAIVGRLHDLAPRRAAPALALTLSSRTLDEARLPLGLAWRDWPRAEAERLGGRIEELAGSVAARQDEGGGAAPTTAPHPVAPPEDELRDLMGYLRDFSVGGAFSGIGDAHRNDPEDRRDGGGPAAPMGWSGPFSEN